MEGGLRVLVVCADARIDAGTRRWDGTRARACNVLLTYLPLLPFLWALPLLGSWWSVDRRRGDVRDGIFQRVGSHALRSALGRCLVSGARLVLREREVSSRH